MSRLLFPNYDDETFLESFFHRERFWQLFFYPFQNSGHGILVIPGVKSYGDEMILYNMNDTMCPNFEWHGEYSANFIPFSVCNLTM